MSRIPWVEIEANSDRDFKIYGKDILNLFNQWGRVNDELKFLKNKYKEQNKVLKKLEKLYNQSLKEKEMIRMELIDTKKKLIEVIKENKEISIGKETDVHFPQDHRSNEIIIEDIKEIVEIESVNVNFKYICPNCDFNLQKKFVNNLRRGFNQSCPQCHFMISFKALIPIIE